MKTEIVIYLTGLYSNYLLELKGTSKIEGPEMRTYLHALWIVSSALHQLARADVWQVLQTQPVETFPHNDLAWWVANGERPVLPMVSPHSSWWLVASSS